MYQSCRDEFCEEMLYSRQEWVEFFFDCLRQKSIRYSWECITAACVPFTVYFEGYNRKFMEKRQSMLGFFLNTIHWSSFNNCLQNPECHGLFPVYAKISTHPGGMWIQCVTAKKKKLSNCISRCCDLAHFILNLMNSDIFVQIGHLWQCHKHT